MEWIVADVVAGSMEFHYWKQVDSDCDDDSEMDEGMFGSVIVTILLFPVPETFHGQHLEIVDQSILSYLQAEIHIHLWTQIPQIEGWMSIDEECGQRNIWEATNTEVIIVIIGLDGYDYDY